MNARPKIFTAEVLARISEMVAQGLSRAEIASLLGCKTTSLTTVCSVKRISLRRGPRRVRAEKVKPTRPSEIDREKMSVRLSPDTMRHLQLAAYRKGVSTATLASTLLDVIANDDLYDAVLDEDRAPPWQARISIGAIKNETSTPHRHACVFDDHDRACRHCQHESADHQG